MEVVLLKFVDPELSCRKQMRVVQMLGE